MSTKEEVINEAVRRFAECAKWEEMARVAYKSDLIACGWKPPTRWQRVKRRIASIGHRVRDIGIILSGGDVHRNCGQ